MIISQGQAGHAKTKQTIIQTGQRLSYVKAFNLVRDIGGLPSNVLHDDTLVRSDVWKQLKSYYAAWAREVLVYPEQKGRFKKGEDVVDAYEDEAGRTWVFPASSMPEEAVGKAGVALFVDPQNVRIDGKRIIIDADPKSITIISPFLQENGWGRVDERTRVPLALAPDTGEFNAKRYLWRLNGIGVRPIVRDSDGIGDKRTVYAIYGREGTFGVGLVGHAEAAQEIEAAKVTTEKSMAKRGLSVEQFKALQIMTGMEGCLSVEQFKALQIMAEIELSADTEVMGSENLKATKALVDALRIK